MFARIISKYIFLLTLFGFAQNAGSQNYNQLVKFADENYKAGDFYGASLYYRKALDIDSLDINVLWKYADCLKMYNEYELAEYYYSKIYFREEGKVFPLSAYWWATMQKHNQKYKEAQKTFKIVTKQYSKEKKGFYYLKARQEIQSCAFALKMRKDTTGYSIKNMGETINTYDSEFGASKNDNTLYYSSLRADKMGTEFQIYDPNYKIKIFEAANENKIWTNKGAIDSIVNSVMSHNANGTFSLDKKRFYFTRCDEGYKCRIMYCKFTDGKWSDPQEAGNGINSGGFTSTQPIIAKVGEKEVLLFSSDREGGQGKMDIWYSEILNGSHGKPKNAGKAINSIDDEITPFYDEVNSILYFSSNWHEGLGGFDVFKTEGPLDKLSQPINAGYPLNTSWNDMYFSVHPTEYVGFITSNRKGSMFKKGPTCCNDLYQIDYPKKEEPKDTVPYKSLEDLNKYLPVVLYFHNDEPNPRVNDTTTKLNYMTTYNAYTALQEKYKTEYSKGLEGAKAQKAQDDIESFFMDYVDKGVSDLEIFTKLLLEELGKGQKIELLIKGFASPLAKTDYNVHLTKRRIASLVNYLREYNGGVFNPYIDGTSPNGGRLFFVKIPFGEYTAKTEVSDDYYDQKNSIYNRSAALERKIEIQTVQRALKDSIISELRVNKEAHDFGPSKPGDVLTTTFTIRNAGKADLLIENVIAGCDCVATEYPKEGIKPGESAEIKVTFDTKGYLGKQVRSITVVCNGFPPNKRLVVTTEVLEKK